MKKLRLPLLLGIICSFLLSSCAAFFYPKYQKVTFTTNDPGVTVYMDNRELGKGTLFAEKVRKMGPRQLILKAPGFKDTYRAMVQDHRAPGYAACVVLDIALSLGIGVFFDFYVPKGISYPKHLNLNMQDKLVYRKPEEKFIDISNMRLDIRSNRRDIIFYYLPYKASVDNDIREAEKKRELADLNKEMLMKRGKYRRTSPRDPGDHEVKYDDTKFSYNIFKTLKNTGFIDTVNRVFADNNNTLVLEGSIRKVNLFYLMAKLPAAGCYRSRMFIRWYIKNNYNEIIDSVDTKEISGDFVDTGDEFMDKMFGDAVDISYLKLHTDGFLSPYIKQETDFKNPEFPIAISAVESAVTDKSDAVIASVIIKNSEGHGSGFAVSQDGYILTNYHVIAGKYNNRQGKIKVVSSDGTESEAQIVRYNKYRDLALLKIDKKFDKAFRFSSKKTFENLQDVYTIGAPKSIELGQSFAMGVISNERKINHNDLLQLGMSVNGGNSGGPVFDAKGNLHGVIVSKLAGQNTEGVSFAIPGYLIGEYLNIHYK